MNRAASLIYAPSRPFASINLIRSEAQTDFFGMLGFHENLTSPEADGYGFLMYNFQISTAIGYEDQLLFVGTPSRNGAEVITISRSAMARDGISLVRLVTPDDHELDYIVMEGGVDP